MYMYVCAYIYVYLTCCFLEADRLESYQASAFYTWVVLSSYQAFALELDGPEITPGIYFPEVGGSEFIPRICFPSYQTIRPPLEHPEIIPGSGCFL